MAGVLCPDLGGSPMGVVAPQWLLPAYVRSVTSLGASATAEQVHAAGEHLIEM